VISNIWNAHIHPYLFRRNCFRRKSRLEDWLKENRGAIQSCPLELQLSEAKSECRDIKAGAYLYLNAFKAIPANWQDRTIYYHPTAAILDLERFSSFDEFERTVSKRSRGNDNRSVKKAQRLGYRTRVIRQSAYQASIDRIRRSKLIRTSGLMLDAVRPRATLIDGDESVDHTPSCRYHWSICWGAFKDGRLGAYALLTRSGNIIRTIDIMGHRDALHDGALKLLVFDVVHSLLERETEFFRGIRYFMYGALEHGREGLFEWKRRLQFYPALLDLRSACVDNLPPEFDETTYLDCNPDVRKAKVDARMHYMVWGKHEGRRYR
jgi:hypothetical protein